MKFSKKFRRIERLLPRHPDEKSPRYVATFDVKEGEELLVKVALSASGSLEAANRNMEKEIPGWDFEAVRLSAERKWNEILDRVEVAGPDGGKK